MAVSHGNHILMVEDDRGRKEYILTEPAYSIGRDQACNIRLNSLFVSRRHATLLRLPKQDGSYYYRILDGDGQGNTSSNGLIINGRKMVGHELRDKDEVVFGPLVKAIYYQMKPDTLVPSGPISDPYDYGITLINPRNNAPILLFSLLTFSQLVC